MVPKCIICFEREIDVFFTVCSHACYCHQCADNILTNQPVDYQRQEPSCPNCRAVILPDEQGRLYQRIIISGHEEHADTRPTSVIEEELRQKIAEQNKLIQQLQQRGDVQLKKKVESTDEAVQPREEEPPPDIEDPCAICYGSLNSGNVTITTLACNHQFHDICMLNYAAYHNYNITCPICRRVINRRILSNRASQHIDFVRAERPDLFSHPVGPARRTCVLM